MKSETTMMNLKNLAYLSVMTATVAACDVEQDLGETATTGSSSGQSMTGGVDDTTGGDTEGPDTETLGETGELETGSEGTEDGSTGEQPGECERPENHLVWDSTSFSRSFGPLFAGAGTCTTALGEVLNVPKDSGEGTEVTLSLSCTLTIRAEGVRGEYVEEAFSTDIVFSSRGDVGALLPEFSDTVRARFVSEAGSFFVVLEQSMTASGEDAPVLIATSSDDLAPVPSSYDDLFEGPWYGEISFSAESGGPCGIAPDCAESRSLVGGWLDQAQASVGAGAVAQFPASTEGGSYDLHVEESWRALSLDSCMEDGLSYAENKFVVLGSTAP